MVLALDLSTKSSGYAVFDDTGLVKWGCLTASSKNAIERIQTIIIKLDKEVLQKYSINKVILEEVRPENQYGVGNQHTHKVLMWLQAALEFLLYDKYSYITTTYVYPNEWRKKCGIKTGAGIRRNELKVADINFVYNNYNIRVNDDIADAIAIGHSFLNKENDNNEINWE